MRSFDALKAGSRIELLQVFADARGINLSALACKIEDWHCNPREALSDINIKHFAQSGLNDTGQHFSQNLTGAARSDGAVWRSNSIPAISQVGANDGTPRTVPRAIAPALGVGCAKRTAIKRKRPSWVADSLQRKSQSAQKRLARQSEATACRQLRSHYCFELLIAERIVDRIANNLDRRLPAQRLHERREQLASAIRPGKKNDRVDRRSFSAGAQAASRLKRTIPTKFRPSRFD